MALSPLAGKPAPASLLINVDQLLAAYHERRPDLSDPQQLVSFGTSGHRGTPLDGSFTEAHILAITQAICDYRKRKGIDGPLFMGKDTHAAVGPAQRTALEVLAANGVETIIQQDDGFTPTPVISHAILIYNRGPTSAPGRRDRHHAVAQSAAGWRLQIQPDQRRPRRRRHHAMGAGPRQRTAARRQSRRQTHRLTNRRSRPRTTHAHDLVRARTSTICANVIDMDAIRDAEAEDRRRSARRGKRRLLGADQPRSTG